MKKQAINTFDGGMITDIDELHAKSNILTYARNTEYITSSGNQLILQKREGRASSVNITPGYNIKALEVIDDISYMVSTKEPRVYTDEEIISTYSAASQGSIDLQYNYIYAIGQSLNISSFPELEITSVKIYMSTDGYNTTAQMYGRLYTTIDDGGPYPDKPNTLLGTSDGVYYRDIGSSANYVEFKFSTPVNVEGLNKVVFTLDLDNTKFFSGKVYYSNSGTAHPGGQRMYKIFPTSNWTYTSVSGAAYNMLISGSYITDRESELGTFPSPIYTTDPVTSDLIVGLEETYKPLNNFRLTSATTDEEYNQPFRTEILNIKPDSEITLKLQKTYDGSVNMVFSSDENPVRLINTKFKINGDGTATLIKRRLEKNDNVYSEEEFHKTELIPRYTRVGYIEDIDINSGGNLPAGGYRYYLKYITADGVETDIIEESRTIDIHNGSGTTDATGGDIGEIIQKTISLEVKNLDTSFKGVKVYFSVSAGEESAATRTFRLSNTFDINSDGTATIIHSGYENTTDADPATLNINYSQIKNNTIITTVNNRLALSGATTTLNHKEEYAALATNVMVKSTIDAAGAQASTDIATNTTSNTHANAKDFYHRGEYWDGETYEFGIVFVTDKGVTPVYPVQGIDSTLSATYSTSRLGDPTLGFLTSNGQNPYGIFRTPIVDNYWRISSSTMYFRTCHVYMHLTYFIDKLANFPEIIGYYFVRKERKKDVLMRGILTPVAAVPITTTFGDTRETNIGPWTLGGLPNDSDGLLSSGHKFVPVPDCIMPYGVDRVNTTKKDRTTDIQLRVPIHKLIGYSHTKRLHEAAMYSPDIDCNTTLAASLFTNRQFGLAVQYMNGASSTAFKDSTISSELNPRGLYTFNQWTGPTATTPIAYNAKSGSNKANLTYITENTIGATSGSFAGNTDRNSWCNVLPSWWMTNHVTRENLRNRSKATRLIDIKDFYQTALNSETGTRAGNALKYGRYLGVKFDSITERNLRLMNMLVKNDVDAFGFSLLNNNSDLTSLLSSETKSTTFEPNIFLGYMTTVFSSTDSERISPSIWRAKYEVDDNGSYHAISRRYPVNNSDYTIDIGDGDCYSGLMWKRVFRPRGIDEAPQATDIEAYKEDRRNVGMMDYGYAISLPSKSNYNFHLRVPSNKNDSERDLFGSKRTFLPISGKDSIRGAKLDETDKFNHGYGKAGESIISSFRLNPDAPYYKSEQPNRVYVSDTDIESNFINGFTQFKGLNYKDYNSELGPIQAMVTFNGKIVAAFSSGVSTIGVDERTMVPGSEGDIFMDNAKALASKSEVKSTILGSDQVTSVIATSRYVYGVDTKQYKVWRTDTVGFEVISDLKVQSWLKDTISEFQSSLDNSKKFTVYSTYDARKSEILFTFVSFDRASGALIDNKTIVYNELLQIWVCETDEHRAILFHIDEKKYATRPDFENNIYQYGNQIYSNLLNGEPVEETIIEFIVNKDQNDVKVLENIRIVGNSVVPTIIDYSTDIYKRRNSSLNLQQDIKTKTPVLIQVRSAEEVVSFGFYGLTFSTSLNDITNPRTGLTLDAGDLVTLIDSNENIVKTKIINISEDGENIVFSDPPPIGIVDLYIGHKEHQRLFNTEIHEGITYISPSCSADSKIILPRGKWIKIRIKLEGAAQAYISGIASIYNQSLS